MKFSFILLTSFLSLTTSQTISIRSDLPAPTACHKLGASLSLPNVTVNFFQYVPSGTNLTFTQEFNLSTCARPSQVVSSDMCRVAMYFSTSRRSGIMLEAWLPTKWTWRFLSTGNGGTSGCIQYEDMAYTTSLRFATVGANNGHNGTSGLPLYKSLDVVHDFADRSMHTGVVVGKQITRKYYGAAHKKSYYLGCSTGGRQGWKAIQDYPEDFDGVVAGAPVLAFLNLTAWSGHFFSILGFNSSKSYIPNSLWSTIHTEILNQCDGLDGFVDGIIEDPLLCNFRPESLLCSPSTADATKCLTSAQVSAVRAVFTDYDLSTHAAWIGDYCFETLL